jgi:hypothetical protein
VKSFNGQLYYDDRLFLMHLCLGTIEIEGDLVTTTIYHENAPPDSQWCLVTYRNCERYPASGVLHFETKDDALAYVDAIEPTTPLISEDGASSRMSRVAYAAWKRDEKLAGYDYRKCYLAGGSNPKETVIQTREQFLASQRRVNDTLRVS